MATRLMRFADLKESNIVTSWPQLRRLVDDHGFPPGYLLSPAVRVWDADTVEAWIDERRKTGATPRRRGSPKKRPKLLRNAQWQVTTGGIEAIGEEYFIDADRLSEVAPRGPGGADILDWPIHMAEKPWVDLELFIEAYVAALNEHEGRYRPDVSPQMLDDSLRAARTLSRRLATSPA